MTDKKIRSQGNLLLGDTLTIDDGSGNVGIGTASPNFAGHFVDDVGQPVVYINNLAAGGDGLQIRTTGTVASDFALKLESDGGNTQILQANNDGTVGIGTFSPTAPLQINTGPVGINSDVVTQPVGSINFGNVSSSSVIPTISGKSTTSAGLFLIGLTSDGNTNPDMWFSVREDDGGEFATLAGRTAFRWSTRFSTLGEVSREGAWTLGPSTNSPGHDINGHSALPGTSGSADDRILRLSPTGSTAVLDMGFDTFPTPIAWIQSRRQDDYSNNLRLDLNRNGGDVYIGSTAATGRALTARGVIVFLRNTNNAGTQYATFRNNTDTTTVGSITRASASTTAFNTSSDERLKENFVASTYGLDTVLAVPVYEYNYIVGQDHHAGWKAQDMNLHFPNAVTVGGEDANEDPWMIDYSRVTPVLWKALQELDAKHEAEVTAKDATIAALAARIDALENP
jgi:hypothetical protein